MAASWLPATAQLELADTVLQAHMSLPSDTIVLLASNPKQRREPSTHCFDAWLLFVTVSAWRLLTSPLCMSSVHCMCWLHR